MIISKDMKSSYQDNGFIIIKHGIDVQKGDYLSRLEQAIDQMAASIQTPRSEYLKSVSRWDSPNSIVTEFVQELLPAIQPLTSSILGRETEIIRSSIIRKSHYAGKATHGHQDSGYWLRNDSQTYDISSWIALENVDNKNGALRIIPASHLNGPQPQQDFLSGSFKDPALSWHTKTVTLNMSAGDILLFSPCLWHASHTCRQGRTRSGMVIRWSGKPSIYQNISTHNIPSDSSVEFGMATSGKLLSESLSRMVNKAGHTPPDHRDNLIQLFLDLSLTRQLPDPAFAESALNRLLILTRAQQDHNGNDLGSRVWEEIRDSVVEPCKVIFKSSGNE